MRCAPTGRLLHRFAALLGLFPLVSFLAFGAAPLRADTSACRATAEVQPSAAVVGQQILYRVRIVRRQDVEKVAWVRGLSFPDFRVEWLPGHAEDTQMHYRGMTFVAREEDRALFPTHAGVFEIPEASLRCTIRGRGPDPPRSEVLRVPAIRVRVVDPPIEGRPDRFAGAVGPLWVQTSVGASEIELGESISLSILVRGASNLWDLPAPLREDAFDAEVFWRPPGIDLEAGEKLYLRRYFRLDLVPHETGPLVIPAIHIPFYDFRTGHYEVAEAEAVTVKVLPRATLKNDPARAGSRRSAKASDTSGQRAARPDAADDTADERGSGLTGWTAAAALALSCLAITLTTGAVRRRRRWAPTAEALGEADQASAAGNCKEEAAALSRALYAALAVAAADLDSPSSVELRARAVRHRDSALASAADAIDALERTRFSVDANSADNAAARAAVERLRARSRSRR